MLRRYNALDKHIVSFSEQLCKRNTRSTLAVIFVPKNIHYRERGVICHERNLI
nr:MAG TPA: hypothetical protein [Caudoviricetes sp.]